MLEKKYQSISESILVHIESSYNSRACKESSTQTEILIEKFNDEVGTKI
jgi:hypothetical protein